MAENTFSDWKSEIYDALAKSRSYCFAVYSSEKKLIFANDELTKANEDKDSFLKILAHDLRNPMLSISGFSELLLSNFRNYDEEKMEKHLNILHNSAKRTFDLLEELLLWSRSQSGKIPFEPKVINFKALCKEVISLMTESARSKEIDIIYQDNTDIQLFADANMLRTIMRNLISNAIKFSHSKGKITITAKPAGAFATITVSDNGIGIGQGEIARLLQISEVYTILGTKGEKGTGFGLMLCKEFVDKHGGKIFVESEIEKGSDFQFTMPLYSEQQ